MSNTKQIHNLINLDNEKINKSENSLTSEFTKKLKLNPNAKPIHFSSKLKSDSNSSFYNIDSKANNSKIILLYFFDKFNFFKIEILLLKVS